MKKTLLTILCVLTAFCAMAQNEKIYTEPLVVTINGFSSEPQDANVIVIDNGNGTINFELKNFVLVIGGNEVGVGNIALDNLAVTEGEDGLQHFSYDGPLTITPGDKEGVDLWIGPGLNEIPLKLVGKMNDEKLFVTIDIDMRDVLQQMIYVQLGTDDFSTPGKVGDLNGDGKVDIADAVSVLNIMAVGDYKSDADLNHDQKVDIADFVSILNIMAEQ